MIKLGILERMLKKSLVFKPKKTKINFETQHNFPYGPLTINSTLRDFYESLTQAIFSGKLRNRSEELEDIEPDILDYRRKRYIEVKCTSHSRRVMLKDQQIEKYAKLQTSESPISNPRVYFTMFRYRGRGIQTIVKGFSSDDVTRYLTENTTFMIGLPFSIVYHVHKNGPEISDLFTRCDTEKSTPCTNFSTRAIDLFFSEPEEAIKAASLDPEDFTIRRTKTSKRMLVNSYPLQQFPITLIKDTNEYHSEFIRDLIEQNGGSCGVAEKVPF